MGTRMQLWKTLGARVGEARTRALTALGTAVFALTPLACGGAPDEGGGEEGSIATTQEAFILNPALPSNFVQEHHAWHANNDGTGFEFLRFHRAYITRNLQWAFGQGMNLSGMYEWEELPLEYKQASTWNTTLANAETRLRNLSPVFNSENELGAFINSSGLHGFMHNTGSVIFNEPVLSSFDSPVSSYFYQIHGLVERYHQHWLNWKRSNIVDTSNALYARHRTTGNFHRRETTGTWTMISGPARMFVAIGTTLYRLSLDGNTIARYSGSGTTWTNIGGPAIDIFRCGASLCSSLPLNPFVPAGYIFRFNSANGSWNILSAPMRNTSSSSTAWYGAHPTGTFSYRFNESTSQWDATSVFGGDLFVTSSQVFETYPVEGNVWRRLGSGVLNWENIGPTARTFVALGSNFYRLAQNGSAVAQWTPTTSNRQLWTNIGGAADWIYGSINLYMRDTAGVIFRRDGSTWTNLGQP
jgi:hypothetical protein